MKIEQIGFSNGANFLRAKRGVFNNSSLAFRGYVNGNYYKDSVIAAAKAALKDTKWKEKLLEQKKDNIEGILKWHDTFDTDVGNRIVGAIFSLGLSELVFTTLSATTCIIGNTLIEKEIDQIARCIDDLRHEGY